MEYEDIQRNSSTNRNIIFGPFYQIQNVNQWKRKIGYGSQKIL